MDSKINTLKTVKVLSLLILLVAGACATASHSTRSEHRTLASTPQFPDVIYIKTARQTFNSLFYYALDDDGRIWVKPITMNDDTKDLEPGWQLLGTGLPENSKKSDFANPNRIQTIQADADELMAFSDENRGYSMRWLANPVFPGSPRQWTDVIGWPVEGPYVWDDRSRDHRAWGIGRRNKIVKYFQDVDGKSFDGGGGLTTYYFLSHDGTEIDFSDSGLPPDFSHTMCGPRRSTFISEGFDVSASTMFVINKYGEMFTRMSDFDTIGSDVMFFQYTYDRSNKNGNLISVPAEDWLEHAKISLTGQARISSLITIRTIGIGNQGRELRVAGYDSQGNPGFYYKQIFHQQWNSPVRDEIKQWNFMSVPGLVIDPNRLLDPNDADRQSEAMGAPVKDIDYQGVLRLDGFSQPLKAELSNFNLQCSPTTLRISSGDDSIDLVFHTVEEWYHLKRFDPGRDGTPKRFLGTIEIPAEAYQTQNPQLQALLSQTLKSFNLKDFGFWVEATQDYVIMTARSTPKNSQVLSFAFTRRGAQFPSAEIARQETLKKSGLSQVAASDVLKVSGVLKTLTVTDLPELEDKVQKNLAVAQDLKEAFEAPIQDDSQTPFFIKQTGLKELKRVGTILGGAVYWAPYVKTLFANMPSLVAENDKFKQTILVLSQADYDQAITQIQTRVEAYQRRIAELQNKAQVTDWIYSEDAESAWAKIALGPRQARPHEFEGSALGKACTMTVDDTNINDGLSFSVDCGDLPKGGALRFQIALPHLTRDVYEATAGQPLQTPATIQLLYTNSGYGSQQILQKIFTNISDLKIGSTQGELTVEDGSYVLSLSGFNLMWER